MGKPIRMKSPTLDNTLRLFAKIVSQLRPPPDITISEWSDQNRWLSEAVSSQPGPWRTAYTPYLREIMDTIGDPDVERVVIMSAARAGKTSVILNMLGYFIDHQPAPIMIVMPAIEDGEDFSKEQLAPFIRDTRCVREKVYEVRSRDGNNTLRHKMFPGGFLALAGSNSPRSLAAKTIKYLAFDEVDRAPDSAGTEGDPVKLAEKRTQTYEGRGRKIILASTPTVKGASRIEKAYNQSTMERWCLPCPSCGELQPLSWQQMNFATVQHFCRECGCLHGQTEWTSGDGRWLAENPDAITRGFHVNALSSPFVRWETLIDEWREAITLSEAGDNEQLKVFINTALGETWEERGEKVDQEGLLSRREEYHADIPDGVCLLTMGVDTQDNRLAYEVVGWGAGKESWGIEYGELWGDPRVPGSPVWNQLDDIIKKRRTYGNGRPLGVSCTAMDSGGHAPDQVCAYTKARQGWNVWAVRGEGGQGKPLVKSWSTNKKTRATVFTLGVDTGKDEIVSRLRVSSPGPGYCHFPKGLDGESINGYDERYFAGLTAEKKVSVPTKNGFRKYQWVKPSGAANEPFDCHNYAGAALAILKVDAKKLEQLAVKEPWLQAVGPKTKKKKSRNSAASSSGVQL